MALLNVKNSLSVAILMWVCVFCTFSFQVQAQADFDHLDTGFPLDGVHAELACDNCHIGGVYDELPTVCAECHNGTIALGQPSNHIPVTLPCDRCHTTDGFQVSGTQLFDHSGIGTSNCAACHNSVNAGGKPANHILTQSDCGLCHGVDSWFVSLFDHTNQDTGTCSRAGCHSGLNKALNHPLTTDACEFCHIFVSWLPYIQPLDHSQVLGSCSSGGCHNAADKSPAHPLTSNVCEACHSSGRWLPLQTPIAHSHTVDVCINCHNGTIATGKSSLHPVTVTDCALCHQSGAAFLNLRLPLDHNAIIQPNCASLGCHNSNEKPVVHPPSSDACELCHVTTSWRDVTLAPSHSYTTGCTNAGCHIQAPVHPATVPNCENCHTYPLWADLTTFDHVFTSAGCTSSLCHDGASSRTFKSAAHPVTSNACELCHTNSTWRPLLLPFAHTETTDLCQNCHNGTVATGKGALHPQTTNTCDSCHQVGVSWLSILVPFDHTQVTNIAATCKDSGCHTTADEGGHGNCGVTNLDCVLCHNTSGWLNNPDSTLCGTTGGGTVPPPTGGGGGGTVGGNNAPTAVITGPATGFCNTNYTFDGTLSADPENDPLNYTWTIGTAILTGPFATQSFNAAGTYIVTLVVNDGQLDSLPVDHTIVISGGMGCGM
ncbi:MAG: PKD domain-containing protein [Gammaproteobacteria bacterium]|nr:PKD domain-containing protein [Gammaproteobacteria bacterium]MDH5799389.1 PKD domain-containing protein [Gammaproteobacteria bacterium]